MCVVPERGPLCRRDTRGAWFRPNARCAGVVPGWCGRWMLVATQMACRAAEQIVQAEAATRPRDRAFFDAQNRLERDPDLSVAAPLNSTVGRAQGSAVVNLHAMTHCTYNAIAYSSPIGVVNRMAIPAPLERQARL